MPFFVNAIFLKAVEETGDNRRQRSFQHSGSMEEAGPDTSTSQSIARLRRRLLQMRLAKGWGELPFGGTRVVPVPSAEGKELAKAFAMHLATSVKDQGVEIRVNASDYRNDIFTYEVEVCITDVTEATTYAANNTGIAKKLGTFGDRAAQGLGTLAGKTVALSDKVARRLPVHQKIDAYKEAALRRAWNRSLSGLVQGQEGVHVEVVCNSSDYQDYWVSNNKEKQDMGHCFWQLSPGDLILRALEDADVAVQAKDAGLLRPYILLSSMSPQQRAIIAHSLGKHDTREKADDSPMNEAWMLLSTFDGIAMRAMGMSETVGRLAGQTPLLPWYEILERLLQAAHINVVEEVLDANARAGYNFRTAATGLGTRAVGDLPTPSSSSSLGRTLPMPGPSSSSSSQGRASGTVAPPPRASSGVGSQGASPQGLRSTLPPAPVAENQGAIVAMEAVILQRLQEKCVASLSEEAKSKVLAAGGIINKQMLSGTPLEGLGPLGIVLGAQDGTLANQTLNTIKRIAPGIAASVGAGFFFGPLGMVSVRAFHAAYLKLGSDPLATAVAVQDICLQRLRLMLRGCDVDEAQGAMCAHRSDA